MQFSNTTFALRLALGFLVWWALFAVGDDAGAQPTGAVQRWGKHEDEFRSALQRPDIAAIREAFNAGVNVHARDGSGNTVLHTAVNFRSESEIIRLVLDKGADINALNDDGDTPLLTALRWGHYRHEGKGEKLLAVMEFLLARGASAKLAGRDGKQPLRIAMDPVNIPAIHLLLKHGAAAPDDGLDWALSNDRVELAKLLMERATPGMLAFKDPHGGGMLHRAAERLKMQFVMEWLVGKGADINAADNDSITPFGRAAQYDNISGMAYLAGLNADTKRASTSGQTPLHLAAYGARPDVMGWLIERGADIKVKDKWGRIPLDIAIDTHPFAFYDEGRKEQLVALLGGSRSDILRGRYARNPLHEATEKRDLREVKRLLEAGANPNVKNASGQTPLYWAIALSSGLPATPTERAFGKELLPLLISHGADPDMRMGDGSTERTYAQYARDLRIGDLLERTRQRYAPRGK